VRRFNLGRPARLVVASLFALAATIPAGGSVPAQAYNVYGWSFDHNSFTYFIAATGGNAMPGWDVGHVNDAADSWTARPTTNLFLEPGGTSTTTADVQVLAYTDPSDGSGGHGGCFNLFTGSNGSSYCYSRSGNGYAELNFNPNDSQTTTPVYDQYIAGHELGHSVGLDHSCATPSLMRGPASPCTTEPYECASETSCTSTPQTDDDNGVIALYGAIQPPSGPGGPGGFCFNGLGPLSKPDVATMLAAENPAQVTLDVPVCV